MKSIPLRSLTLAACFLLVTTRALPAAEKPNVIVILADDMGYSDLGCYGGEISTPNLDRLAMNGLRFTQFYNTARCCPTRASLLTGLYPHQAGVGHMMDDKGLDGYRGDLNQNCVTIAEALRPAGYRTYMLGKWHVTRHDKPDSSKHNWPLQRGFDRYYGTIIGGGTFFDPAGLTRDNTMITAQTDPEYHPSTTSSSPVPSPPSAGERARVRGASDPTDTPYYYTHALSDHAVRFVSNHQRDHANDPFFMYLAFTAAHWPMHALDADIARQKGKYDTGYDPIRKARFEKAKKLGLIDPNWTLTPTKGDWPKVENKAWEARCMEVYAAMIESMDRGLGQLIDELRRTGQLDNTLILFLQDNGGCAETVGRSPDIARADKPSLPVIPANELLSGSRPNQTRDGWPMLTGRLVMPGPRDTFIAYGEGWANVSNTPFREYKHWVHEGGISTPLIAHWPARIQAKGELRHQPGHLIDIMATALDISGAKYPTEHAGQKITALEGRSLTPVFDGRPIDRDVLFWEHEGNRALRVGDWKLVAKGPAAPWELYDLKTDRTEMQNLAATYPDRVKEMAAKWETHAKRTGAIPWIWKPQYGATASTSDAAQKQLRFELKPDDKLSGDEAPRVVNRSLRITARIETLSDNGVLIAQGGSSHGYSLYLKDGLLTLAVRRGGRQWLTACNEKLPTAPLTVIAVLSKDGQVTLKANEKSLATGKLPGGLVSHPQDGLEIGRDENGAVGDYKGPFPFQGKLGQVVIELKE